MEHDVFISYSFKDQAIAEKIVNTLTSIYGLTCWICTREIRGGEKYKEKIVEAIDEAEVVVLIVSENAVVSAEIPKEVGIALEDGKTVVPFKIDQSRFKGEMRYDLMGTNWIDGSEPPVDDRIDELAEHLCMILGKSFSKNTGAEPAANSAEKLVSTPSVIPKKIFCGRDDVLEKTDEMFSRGERIVFLYGIGGIGKTQIAKQYARRKKEEYDTIIYATYNGSLKSMIIAEEPFKIEPAMIRYTLSDGSKESDDDFCARKLRKIKELATERTLVILDNFDVTDDEYLDQIADGRYDLLITTRCDYSRTYPATIRIEEIASMEELKRVFFANYKGDEVEEDDEHIEELIETVNRHTYTIELLAQHMENSGQTTEEMLAELKKEGILSLNETVTGTQVAYENLLKMFRIFSLTEEEKRILTYLSLMPLDGVKKSDFKKWAALSSLSKVNSLEERGWIVKNTGGIALHPIVRDVVRHECKPTEEECKEFLDNIADSCGEKYAWFLKKTDKDRYAKVFKSIVYVFDEINDKNENLYYNAENLMSFAVDPEFAAVLSEKIYSYYKNTTGETSFKTARSAFKYGWLYAYNLHLKNATEKSLFWLGKASDLFDKMELVSKDEIAALTQTWVNLAKSYLILFEDTGIEDYYSKAKKYAEKTLAKTSESFLPGERYYGRVAGAYWQLSEVLLAGGDLEKALENIEKSLEILLPMYSEHNSDSVGALHRKGAVLVAMKRYEEAKTILEKSSVGYAEFFGHYHSRVCEIYVLLGDCHLALGNRQAAMNAYCEAEEIALKLFSPDAKQINEIKAKIVGLKADA